MSYIASSVPFPRPRLDEFFFAAAFEALFRLVGSNRHRYGGYLALVQVLANRTAELHRAFDALVGPGRWLRRESLGTFPVRFPSPGA